MKVINKVTVTGADDSTDIDKMFEIQEKYPFVEWGILLSEKYSLKDGTGRFPSKKWLVDLINHKNSAKLNLSGHICGKWVTKTLLGDFFPPFDIIHGNFTDNFSRFQLNTHAEFHKVNFEKLDAILRVLRSNCQGVIFQLDGVNDIMVPMWKRNHRNISGLFDLSHGAGTLPSTWPKPIEGMYCGYAGGLSPDNVVEQMEKILIVNGNKETWIDAETQLRSPDNRVFDLDKVVQFLENSKPYVI